MSDSLAKQPKRGTDRSSAIKQPLIAKSMMTEGETKMIKREKGVEKQYRWKCPGCDLALCYQSTPFDSTTKFVFAMAGALTTHEEEEEEQEGANGGGSASADAAAAPAK